MADQHKPVTGYPAGQSSYTAPTTGAAYPYPAQPPPYYYPPNPYPPQPSSYSGWPNNRLRRFIAVLIGIAAIFGVITFILWLVLRPRLPQFTVDSASISHFNLNSSQLTANWDISLTAFNPNKKMDIHYESVEASVLYGYDSLSDTSLPPFHHGKKNLTHVHASFAVVSKYVDQTIAGHLTQDRNQNGALNFHLRLLAWARFRAGAWRMRRHLMRVLCEDIRIGLASGATTGTLQGTPRKCEVDI